MPSGKYIYIHFIYRVVSLNFYLTALGHIDTVGQNDGLLSQFYKIASA